MKTIVIILIGLLLFALPVVAQESVYIQGEVSKQGLITYTTGMTVTQAVAAAGGFTKLAHTDRITVRRGDRVIKVRLQQNEDIQLQSGDVVLVPQRLF